MPALFGQIDDDHSIEHGPGSVLAALDMALTEKPDELILQEMSETESAHDAIRSIAHDTPRSLTGSDSTSDWLRRRAVKVKQRFRKTTRGAHASRRRQRTSPRPTDDVGRFFGIDPEASTSDGCTSDDWITSDFSAGSCSEPESEVSDTEARGFIPLYACEEEDEESMSMLDNSEKVINTFIKRHNCYVSHERLQETVLDMGISRSNCADYIVAFELLDRGKGYITWQDVRRTMEFTLQRPVPESEAQDLVTQVTGKRGKPMNFFDFLRFSSTSNERLLNSLQPVVLHL